MSTSVTQSPYRPVDPPLREHLITMLDQVLWLTQWSANVAALPGRDRQALEGHLAELDAELRNVLRHPVVRPTPTSET
jgi:hypothetical protein